MPPRIHHEKRHTSTASSSSVRTTDISAASSSASEQDRDLQEINGFIRPTLLSLTAILIKFDQLSSKLEYHRGHLANGTIPKQMLIKDISNQIPASRPELRLEIQRSKNDTEKATLNSFIDSLSKEKAEVQHTLQTWITAQQGRFKAHLQEVNDSSHSFMLNAQAISDYNKMILSKFTTRLTEEVMYITRTHALKAVQEKTKRTANLIKNMEKKEINSDQIEDTTEIKIEKVVAAAVAKALNKAKASSSNTHSDGQRVQQQNGKSRHSNSSKKTNRQPASREMSAAASSKKKNKNDHPSSKNGHPKKAKKPPSRDSESGNHGQRHNNSGNGANSRSAKSNRK